MTTTQKMIAEIKEIEKELCTEWESTFIHTLHCRVKNDQPLSDAQCAKLQEIYEKACDSPY